MTARHTNPHHLATARPRQTEAQRVRMYGTVQPMERAGWLRKWLGR